jgi:hypothetical protein
MRLSSKIILGPAACAGIRRIVSLACQTTNGLENLDCSCHPSSGDRIPRWAATAGHHTLGRRLTAVGARLFRSRADANNDEPELSWSGRRLVLSDYHATTLATARTASEELVRAGFNTGDVPYGYRAHRVQVTPAGGRARWRTRLVLEPVEASTVRMIFVWRGENRLPTTEIRRRLAASRYPAPLDPETGQPCVWTVAMVRAILRNPNTSVVKSGDAPSTAAGHPTTRGCGHRCGHTRRSSRQQSSPRPTAALGWPPHCRTPKPRWPEQRVERRRDDPPGLLQPR